MARKSPKQLNPRKMPPSVEGRMRYARDESLPHSLDVMLDDEFVARADLAAVLDRLPNALDRVRRLWLDVPLIHERDKEAVETIEHYFLGRKHYKHIQATFGALRLRRQAARLQACQEALRLASLLLEEALFEDQLTIDLKQAMEPAKQIHAEMVGTAKPSRIRLDRYEMQLQTIRSLLPVGNGWFETYKVQKRNLSAGLRAMLSVLKLIRQQKPIPIEMLEQVPEEVLALLNDIEGACPLPEAVQILVDACYYGDYVNYRWYNEADGREYTIALGKLSKLGHGQGVLAEELEEE